MPTAATSSGKRRASSTLARLLGASIPTATTRSTPAAVARSRTAGRSAANRSSNRWAWVSISGIGGSGGGGQRKRGGQNAPRGRTSSGRALVALEIVPAAAGRVGRQPDLLGLVG